MGYEDEVEQSIGRPCRQLNGRSKRHCERTSSIVPRGTSFHHAVELECPPIGIDPLEFSMKENPQDRSAQAAKLVESFGGKPEAIYYFPAGTEYDGMVIVTFPDDVARRGKGSFLERQATLPEPNPCR